MEESACNAGDAGSIPGSGRYPGDIHIYMYIYTYVCVYIYIDREIQILFQRNSCNCTVGQQAKEWALEPGLGSPLLAPALTHVWPWEGYLSSS